MARDDEKETSTLRRDVDESIVKARQIKNQYQSTVANRSVSEKQRQDVIRAVIELLSIVRPWSDSTQVEETWEEYDLDTLDRLTHEHIEVETGPQPLTRSTDTEQRLAICQLSTGQLIAYIDALLEVCRDLGWVPEVRERTPLEIGRPEDVRWILNRRNQDKGLEDLVPPPADEPQAGDNVVTDGGAVVASGDSDPGLIDGSAGSQISWIGQERVPFKGPFWQLASDRKKRGQDVKISVASANAETGVGKTTLAYYLAHVLDTSDRGFVVDDKATMSVGEYLNAYGELQKGSSLILDEAEQLTGRRATSKKNVKTSERLQMNRVKEISAIFTLPKFDVLDPLVQDLLDFRIEVTRLGEATIYRKRHSPFNGTFWQDVQSFEFPEMDDSPGMKQLHGIKDEFLDEDQGGLVKKSNVDDAVRKKRIDKLREERNDKIIEWDKDATLTHRDIVEDKLPQWVEERVPDEFDDDEFLFSSTGNIARIKKKRG